MSETDLQSLLEEAIAHHRAGRVAEAEPLYRQILAVAPDQPIALENLGLVLHKANKLEAAAELLGRALALAPRTPLFYRNLATVHRAMGQPREAVVLLRKACELSPLDGLCWGELGVSLDLAGYVPDALAVYERAIRLLTPLVEKSPAAAPAAGRPPDGTPRMELARAHYNRGSVIGRLGSLDDAMPDYETAIALAPGFAEPHRNRSGVLFYRGQFKQAWAEYEWRWHCSDYAGQFPPYPQPPWDGSPLNGRTILLWWEQGLGDTIQFCRYAPLIQSLGGRVALLVQRPLKRLLLSLDGVDELAFNAERKIDFDTHASLMSLCHLTGATWETIPAPRSYLKADANDVAIWRQRLTADGPGLRVGLVWAGGAEHKNDRTRSIPLRLLQPLMELPGIRFYSLQVGDAAGQIQTLADPGRVINHTAHLDDFADTAAFIDCLDLLISVDTAAAHLAGALGKDVWLLLAHDPDFRWLTDTDHPSRWYPSMRLFRQSVAGEWIPVTERIKKELTLRAAASAKIAEQLGEKVD